MHPTERGKLVEEMLAGTDYANYEHVGRLQRGYFPYIDFWDSADNMVSLKTVDPRGGRGWVNDMKWHINEELRQLQIEDTVTGAVRRPNSVTLDIRVPEGQAATVQAALQRYAQARGVTLVVKELK